MATKWLKMEKLFKNLLVTNHKPEIIHILFEASLGDPLPKLLKLFPLGSYFGSAPAHTILHGIKERNLLKSSSDKPLWLEHSYLVCSIIL